MARYIDFVLGGHILFQEIRVNNLAEQLGAAQVRETELEARMQTEIKRLTAEIHLLKESFLSEVRTKLFFPIYFILGMFG